MHRASSQCQMSSKTRYILPVLQLQHLLAHLFTFPKHTRTATQVHNCSSSKKESSRATEVEHEIPVLLVEGNLGCPLQLVAVLFCREQKSGSRI